MIKMEIEDFIFEVREELICYEQVGEQGADKWVNGFRAWLSNDKPKKNITEQKGKSFYLIEDESEIFAIADEYLEALENNSVEGYWKTFQ